jgi:hypothetical protein
MKKKKAGALSTSPARSNLHNTTQTAAYGRLKSYRLVDAADDTTVSEKFETRPFLAWAGAE